MRKNFSTTGLNFVVKLFRSNFISLFSAFFTKNFSPTYLITLPQTVNHSLCVCNFWQHFVESEKYREILSKLKMLDDICYDFARTSLCFDQLASSKLNLFSKQLTRTPNGFDQSATRIFVYKTNKSTNQKEDSKNRKEIFAYFARIAFNLAASASLSLPDFSAINISLVFPSQSLISGCSRFLARA